ncbi:hypothetical protein ZIOFF_000161 [Zingiber officinale]|uniref:Phytocyanin domain-containing protein n=1 Tax=Zingiber officinale TaxID=94328 RepID=A0A8J5LR84_ZINOF|nr:hypothetical protein ZIOFF_000161 [Zingiber officinale]
MAFSSFSSNGLAFLLLLAVALVDSARGCVFYAGGKYGWVLNPSESYGHWAERNRFQVNDSIVFKYKKGEDSVLVVAEQDFDSCDVSNPIRKLDGGDSRFVFERSGPFFFVSGAPGRCERGQKLAVVVMAVRRPRWPPVSASPVLPPTPASSPPRWAPQYPPLLPPSATLPPESSGAPILSPTPPPTLPTPTGGTSVPMPSPVPAPSDPAATGAAGITSAKSVLRTLMIIIGISLVDLQQINQAKKRLIPARYLLAM